jgi:hypothetical protein
MAIFIAPVDLDGYLTSATAAALYAPLAGATFTGSVTLNGQSDLRLADADSSHYLALQAPAVVTTNVTWTLPATDGSSGQVLSTSGTGQLSWIQAGITAIDGGDFD